MKKHQFQFACIILAKDTVRTARAAWRAVMLDDQDLNGGYAAINDGVQCRALPPVNEADWQMPQHINHMTANPFFKNAGKFCTNTGQACCGGK